MAESAKAFNLIDAAAIEAANYAGIPSTSAMSTKPFP